MKKKIYEWLAWWAPKGLVEACHLRFMAEVSAEAVGRAGKVQIMALRRPD
jgi:hypothetical protein